MTDPVPTNAGAIALIEAQLALAKGKDKKFSRYFSRMVELGRYQDITAEERRQAATVEDSLDIFSDLLKAMRSGEPVVSYWHDFVPPDLPMTAADRAQAIVDSNAERLSDLGNGL